MLRLTPPEEQSNINSLSSLLNAKVLDASDFIDVVNGLSNTKKKDVEKEAREQGEAKTEPDVHIE